MGERPDRDPTDDTDWVDRVTAIAKALGFNPIRVRWKLEAWRDRVRRRREAVVTRAEHARRRNVVCPECGRLSDGVERVCAGCGRRLPSAAGIAIHRVGLELPRVFSVSTLLAIAILAVYARLMFAEGGSLLCGFSIPTLVRFGGHWPPLVEAGEWWRLGTAAFLHAGLWHVLFNLLALSQIGPAVEEVFGRLRMLFLFLLTAVVANLGSEAFGLEGVGIGASGGLMGLIGLAAGWGHVEGTPQSRELRNRMVLWGVYTMIFGYFIGADNAAHGVGFVSGAVLGFVLRPRWWETGPLRALGFVLDLAGLAAAGACVYLALVPPALPAAFAGLLQ